MNKEYELDKLKTELKDALGVFGECTYHLEAWQARQAQAREAVNKLQAAVAASPSPTTDVDTDVDA